MKRFNKIQITYMWPEIEQKLKTTLGEEKAIEVMNEAIDLYSKVESKTKDLKGYEKTHKSGAYAIASLYLSLKKVMSSSDVITLLDETWKVGALKKNAKLNKVPKGLFIKLCSYISKEGFGEKAGFVREDISKDKKEVRFNVYSCPYVNIMKEMGCIEACPIVCRQDEYSYGNMDKIDFIRTKTLGRGDDVCDFCYRIKGE